VRVLQMGIITVHKTLTRRHGAYLCLNIFKEILFMMFGVRKLQWLE